MLEEKQESVTRPTGGDNIDLENIAKDYFGDKYETLWNDEKTYAVVHKKAGGKEANATLHFFVYDAESNEMVFRDGVPRAGIRWVNTTELAVETVPGMVKGDETPGRKYGYTYNVANRKKRPFSN